ncbi:MAG: recombination-associated protein RdgC [Planctomycetota bacterium]
MLFRRSGGFSCYYVEGSVPTPPGPEFLEALSEQRFHDIQDAANEQSSIGWVTANDPTGGSFDADAIDFDAGFWLRVRFDKKSLPTQWVAIHRAAAERALARPLNRRERQELVDDLREKLLPRVLPAVKLLDLLYQPRDKRLLMFGCGKSLRDEIHQLFCRTFAGAHLLPADPNYLAQRLGLSRDQNAYLERVAPVRWTSSDGDAGATEPRQPAAIEVGTEQTMESSQ